MDQLKVGELLPDFQLETSGGDLISPQNYKGKKNVVVVIFGVRCEECKEFLTRAAERYREYQEANAEIIAVGEATAEAVRELASEMQLPFPVVADPNGVAGTRYKTRRSAVIVADRFGEIRLAEYPGEGQRPPDQERIITRLELNELECPECGVPTWPM